MKIIISIFLGLFFSGLLGCSNHPPVNPLFEVFNTKSYLEEQSFRSVVPIEVWNNKIFLTAKINGKPYRFILDTGSPTMLTKRAADALGLKVAGQNTGKDANGNLVTSDISTLDRLEIGEVVFRNIPVLIFDFSQTPMGDCVFDGGIIGSEIMPLSNWQINFAEKTLLLSSDIHGLNYLDKARKASLKLFSYPFSPILEYQINGKFTDNALFDTGNTELLHLNIRAFQALKERGITDATVKAYGTFGNSAGGRGADTDFYWVPLQQLSIGELRFNNINVWTRPEVPTLIGAKILESHVVTLDYANKAVYFHEYRAPATEDTSFGFRPYFDNRSVHVGWIRESSPAMEAGLRLHDQILSINQTDLSNIATSELCGIFEWFVTLNEKQALEVTFKSNGVIKQASLQKK